MKVENAELEAFVVTAELLNFQRAAQKLNLTQPGLSRRIQKLEQTMGVELFHRTTRSVSLTGVGRHFLPMARQQISNLGTMLDSIREVSEKRFGKIRVASLPTVVYRLFPQLLRTYALSHPNIGVQIFDGNNDFVARQVQAGIAEFGVGMDPGAEGDLTFTPLMSEEYVLAVHRADPMAARDRVTLQELGSAKLIIGGRDSGNRLLLEVLLGNAGVSLRWFYEVEHVSCLLDLIDTGIGCAIVPVLTLSQRHDQNIRKVHIDGIDIRRTLGIVRHRSLSISPLATEFMEMLAGNIKNV